MKKWSPILLSFFLVSGCATPFVAPMRIPPDPESRQPAATATTCLPAKATGSRRGVLNAKDVAGFIVEAGFPASEVNTAVAVAMAESGLKTDATNNNTNGSTDYGLFQINSIHQSILSEGDKFDALDNSKMAYKIWKQAGGKWTPWVTYNTGAYKKHADIVDQLPDQTACTPTVPAEMKAGCGKGTVDFSQFSNGRIPREYLCPIAVNPSHMLRPDAAKAFDELSKAYSERFNGDKICITDSYRSYEAQVDVARRKPGLAAKPGTSNHGLGQAVDLACGIHVFGSVQHEWMKANAGKYGWKHPKWAQPDGSKPEPWHWEFGVKY